MAMSKKCCHLNISSVWTHCALAVIVVIIACVLPCILTGTPGTGVTEDVKGEWIMIDGNTFGTQLSSQSQDEMRLMFHSKPDVTWIFKTTDGEKKYAGTYDTDESAFPRQINLSEPGVQNGATLALGIYMVSSEADRPNPVAARVLDTPQSSVKKLALRGSLN